MASFFHQLRRVKWRDIREAWKLPVSLVCMPFYRIKHRNMWIVCEDQYEARDNAYWFFKYVRSHHPEQECIFAIKKKSLDYSKISALGKTVEYGSLKHWICYLASRKKISSQKAGNPNAAIFYFLEVYGLLRDKRVFLQHGVIKDDLKWLYYDVTKMSRFICGAYPEYKYVAETFGYPKGNVCYTGLCRFDGWHDAKKNSEKPMVLIMPTWREWIADEDYRLLEYEGTTEIPKTNYFQMWIRFITDPRLPEMAQKYGVQFVFYPHRNMQKYMDYFPTGNEFVQVFSAKDGDIQDLLRDASMMVTDYSSVFFDMLYMKKPVVFYQFDYDKFRAGQYAEGYFNYRDNPFGKSYENGDDTIRAIEEYIEKGFAVSQDYLTAHDLYFQLYDKNNCERVFEITKEL